MKRFFILAAMAMAGLLLVAGCGGKAAKANAPLQEWGAPDWVIKGSGAFEKERGKVFYGIGSAAGIRNVAMLRSAADNRARNELAKVFEFYTSSLVKDYSASTTAGEPGVSSEEQNVEQAIKTVTARTLSGVEIVERWQHPATMELYSLARLDLKTFADAMVKAEELNDRVKEYIRQNSERLHRELEKEEEKQQGR